MTCNRDQIILLDGYNLTGSMNSLDMPMTFEDLDPTTFGNSTRLHEPGLGTVMASVAGIANTTSANYIYSKFKVADKPFTAAASSAIGSVAYSFKALTAEYTPLTGSVGDLLNYTMTAQASGGHGVVRGNVVGYGTLAADGNGTALQLGAVGSTKKLYAILHVFRVSGISPTLDLTIGSDNSTNFSSPITRVTFDQMTAVGSQWKEVSGAITDDWWREVHDLGGTNPEFDYAVVLAIQ